MFLNNQNLTSLFAEQNASRISKRPRRRTLFIPPEDTTLRTIHSGSLSDNTIPGSCLQQSEIQRRDALASSHAGTSKRHGAKRASLAAAPKRGPLQPTLKPLQEMACPKIPETYAFGKENMPPCNASGQKAQAHRTIDSKAKRCSIFQKAAVSSSDTGGCPSHQIEQTEHVDPYPSSAEYSDSLHRPFPSSLTADQDFNRGFRASLMKKRNSIYYGTKCRARANLEDKYEHRDSPSQFTSENIPRNLTSDKVHYQILREDIRRPELFEDTWLSSQEFAIKQLINHFFDVVRSRSKVSRSDDLELRAKMLLLYQDNECAMIFKRINASLLYGALNPPKSSYADTQRIQSDIGIRQAFLRFWLESYNLEALICAVEVVVGRSIFPDSNPKPKLTSDQRYCIKGRSRSVAVFLESCLLRNGDAYGSTEMQTSVWRWRRTMLRSLMIVLLLDKAKESQLLRDNLFQRSSKIKCSQEALVKLCSLISPFFGDVLRSLSHLHYDVRHIQNPLSEYEYGIRNLATGLRDGVQLTRLVELSLYPPECILESRREVGVVLPDREISARSLEVRHPWPLSQHLKIPCFTPSQKLHNVQIALSALGSAPGVEGILKGIKAEDIVNGYREKTVTLLWNVVTKWGLELMIDFDEVRREIRRISKWSTFKEGIRIERETICNGLNLDESTNLLQQWARSIACRQGLCVANLTTSFSDGKVFAAIVDEYQKFLPKICSSKHQNSSQLTAKLKDIGCSDAFADIFARNEQGRIFDRQFTIAALAFLYSRLTDASRQGIAASVILRAYRESKIRQRLRQRCVLLRLAHDCRSVYITRNQVIGAAQVLQRRWRAYLGQKQQGTTLEQRRSIRRERRGKVDDNEPQDIITPVDIWLT